MCSESEQSDIVDYTEWRQEGLSDDMTVEELSHAAMEFQRKMFPEEFPENVPADNSRNGAAQFH